MASSGGGQFEAKTTGPLEEEEVAVPSFEQRFKELTSLIAFFEGCSKQTQDLIDNTRQTLFQDDRDPSVKPDLMTDAERKQLQSNASKKSTLLVVGQTNSGKSSLINELLGGSYMPTSEVPCTSRIVRLKYSDRNYIQVLGGSSTPCEDPGGSQTQRVFFSQKQVPGAAIVLNERNRDDAEWVHCVVEVGLNNSLLQSGHLEVIDAPGMSENDTLDKLVEECIQGALQVIIYVIDGNSSLRLQERGFLLRLKSNVGHLPIFYVCNKVDHDKRALEFDKDSTSEEDDEDEDGNGRKSRTGQEKQELAFHSLVICGLLSTDATLAECEEFHGISSKEVRTARRRNQTNHYTQEFDLLKTKLLNFAARGVTSHLDGATRLLRQIQERVFELFLSWDVNDDELGYQSQLFDDLEQKERKYFNNMTSHINQNKNNFARIINDAIINEKPKIVADARDMQFAPIQIGDVVSRNEVVHQCEKQIREMVLFKVMKLCMRHVHQEILKVTKKLEDSMKKMFSEVAKKDDRVSNLVTKQLQCSFLQPFQLENQGPHFDYPLVKFNLKYYFDGAVKVVGEMWSAIWGGGTTLDKKWKNKVAVNVLENVNADAIARRICDGILSDLNASHDAFQANLRCMKNLCFEAAMQSDGRRKYASVMAPEFARQTCKAEALLQTLTNVFSRTLIGDRMGRQGHRGTVYGLAGSDDGRVAKQLKPDHQTYSDCLLAIRRVMRRIQDDQPSILKPVRLILDKENTITVLFPRMETDLFKALESGGVRSMETSIRLRIVQNMIKALQHCWGKQIHHVDFRITNILLDQNNTAKLNVSKPRNDSIPYPDDKAPFHVPAKDPDPRRTDPSALGILHKHCLYSLALLLWILLSNKYCRPDYAETADVEHVFDAVAQENDVRYVSEWKVPDSEPFDPRWEALEIVTWSLAAWHDGLASWLYEFEMKITWLISKVLVPEERKIQKAD